MYKVLWYLVLKILVCDRFSTAVIENSGLVPELTFECDRLC